MALDVVLNPLSPDNRRFTAMLCDGDLMPRSQSRIARKSGAWSWARAIAAGMAESREC